MKKMSRAISIIVFGLLWLCSQSASAQFSFPPDTVTYWKMNESGVATPYTRGLDSTIYKGQLIIRFRQGALNYDKLLNTYVEWYFDPYKAHHGKGGNQILDYFPPFPCDSNRGFPDSLKAYLKTERFYIDSSSNIVLDTALRSFLHSMGGKYLRRLTTASPRDMYSVTRRGDTIGCDHYNWMILKYDTATSPLMLSYLLTSGFPNDVFFAEPDRHEGRLLHAKPSHPHDNQVFYDRCEYSLYNMINAPKAWDYEVGDPKILLAHFDRGVDYMDSDLSGGIGAGYHVRFGEQFSLNTTPPFFDNIIQHQAHGTPCMGIMGALTNRNPTSVAGIAGGWGSLPSDHGAPDEGTGCSLVILAASQFQQTDQGISNYVAAVFQASARSDSSEYGYGVDLINTSAVTSTDDIYPSVHGAINYGFLNGVTQVAAVADNDHDESIRGIYTNCFPANYEEPWIISVGESRPDKARISGSDYGFNMDLLAPGGDPTSGDSAAIDQYQGNLHPITCYDPITPNWDASFTIANMTTDNGLDEITIPKHTFHGFGGTSAAAAHVSGSAGLLLSTFLNDTILKLEPEDVGGILKSSSWRGDADRSTSDSINYRRLTSGWGHLDIGNAYTMLDPIPDVSNSHNLYSLKHFHFEDSLQHDGWSDLRNYYFNICWDPITIGNDSIKKKFGKWNFILNDGHRDGGIPFTYRAKVRTVWRNVTLPSEWVIDSVSSPLFAWGRSGGLGEKSGWSFAQDNWQTGWSRVNSCTGGDTLNEGIFHNQGTTFTVATAQYDVWGWNKDSGDYKTYIGHVPEDSMMGINFTVFGRRDLTYSSVNSQRSSGNEKLLVTVNQEGDHINAWYFTDAEIEHPKLEIYDILGKYITSSSGQHAEQGWNSMTCSVNKLVSGTYICRVSGSGFTQSRTFQIVK